MRMGTPVGRRSGCPVNACMEIFGDRWSLLIVRDLMLKRFRTYKQLQSSQEGIASNILAERLERLERARIIESEEDPVDRRRRIYRLTEKGIDLAPVIRELAMWAVRHEKVKQHLGLSKLMRDEPEQFFALVRRRWEEDDTAPLLPADPGER